MRTFIIRRLLLGVVVLFIVTIFCFILMHLIPGDPVRVILGIEVSQEQIDAFRAEHWLDRPIMVQYGHWLFNVFRGDFGDSIVLGPINSLIAARLPITIYLSILSLIVSVIGGIGIGIICAIRRGGVLDSIFTLLTNLGLGIPLFWLGILGIYLFGLILGWLPVQGFTSPFDDFWLSTRQVIMPVFCLAVPSIAVLARQTRASMVEVIYEDYIRTAWSKGLSERVIILRHGLKNALLPIVTLIGVQVRILIGGSVLVETVFNISGIGRLLTRAVFDKDILVVQGVIFIIAVCVIVVNLLVDISYGWINPRVRYD